MTQVRNEIKLISPLQGFYTLPSIFVGRCPTLMYQALSGLSLIYQSSIKRLKKTGNAEPGAIIKFMLPFPKKGRVSIHEI